jgi:REP element-mobilizing transposase RayT
MENHVHLVAEAPDLSAVLQAFKRHTAQQLIELAQLEGRDWLLSQFAFYKKAHKRQSRFQVWQEGSHPQLIQGDDMMRQMIEYIHANPLRRGWVDAPEHWRYSSARNYCGVGECVLEIDPLPI